VRQAERRAKGEKNNQTELSKASNQHEVVVQTGSEQEFNGTPGQTYRLQHRKKHHIMQRTQNSHDNPSRTLRNGFHSLERNGEYLLAETKPQNELVTSMGKARVNLAEPGGGPTTFCFLGLGWLASSGL